MASLTPMGYADKYWNLPVPIVDDATEQVKDWVTVRVASYRLGANESAMNDFMSKARPRLDQKDGKKKVVESITVHVRTVGGSDEQKTYGDRFALAANAKDPFYGKGCPEEVQVTLQLAVRMGVILPKAGETIQKAIQAYCDSDRLGLDCNGFIGNYVRHVLQGVAWHSDPGKGSADIQASSTITSIMAHCTPITSTEQVVTAPHRSYVLAWADPQTGRIKDGGEPPGHIMITEPGPAIWRPWRVWAGGFGGVSFNNRLALHVVESTGKNKIVASLKKSGFEGLVHSQYLLLEENKGKHFTTFKVHRGSKDELMHVRIAAVPGT